MGSSPFQIVQPKKVTDPVCGMSVDPAHAAGSFAFEGVTYYFCAVSCLDQFRADPNRYLHPAAEPEPMQGGQYTCPMHPEVLNDGFGTCPHCGMALEPVEVSLGQTANPELADMSRRFWIALVFAVPVFVLGMAEAFPWVQCLLSAPAVFWAGWPVFERAAASIRRLTPNMFTLIAVGTAAAWGYSAWILVSNGHPHVYFEAAAVIVTLVLLGQVLELRARERTTEAIRGLLELAPKTARTATGEEIAIDRIRPGELLLVRPGERIPADGTVTEGSSAVDESAVTGEAEPAEKQAGAPVTAGTLNGAGSFVMRAARVGRDTLLARMVQLTAQAQRTRAPVQRLADRVAAVFVPAVLVVAVVTFAVWYAFGGIAPALVNSVAVLIIACPCAVGLATPMSILVGTGRAARAGILVRSAEALERLAGATTLVVDKTGTVTEGRPRVTLYQGDGDGLRIAATLEQASEHPLAAAVLAYAREQGAVPGRLANFQYLPGLGVTGNADGTPAALGSGRFMNQMGLGCEPGRSLYVAAAGRVVAAIDVEDPVKESAAPAIEALRQEGMHVVMLTGDRAGIAEAVAARVGISEVHADVLPAAKHKFIADRMRQGGIIAMAGDGVNDAPALAQADVGIAMGNGTGIAMEAAGITLVKGDLRGIVRARKLSRAVLSNIRQNLFFAFFYNLLGVPVAAGLLYPFTGLLLNPMIAAAAMTLSSVSVITNALRLRDLEL